MTDAKRYMVELRIFVVRSVLLTLSLLCLIPSVTLGDVLPQSIGSLQLENLQVGEEARLEIDRLHGKHLDFRKGWVATYVGGGKKAKVWLSEYDSEAKATEANERMARKIQAMEGKGFWHFRQTSISETPVNFVMGQGQAHYFFQKGKKVIWLAVNPSEAKKTIRDLIGQIP